MPLKIKDVSIIGPYGVICGVAEYQRFFVEALERQGCNVAIIGNRFNGGYRSCGLYDDRAATRAFGTGHAAADDRKFAVSAAVEVASKARVCYLNYQDYLYPDKANLYLALAKLSAKGVALHLILHDTCLPQQFPFELFRAIIVPSVQMKSARFPTAGKVFVVPQGVPIFKKGNRKELRESLVLCEENELMITTFGLGRSNNAEVLSAAKVASKILGLPEQHPIYVQMIFAKEEDLWAANEQFGNEYNVYLNGGYLEDHKLACYIQASNAVVLNYPQISQYATSSALRFALGAGSLIFTRQSNWFADVRDCNLYIPFDSPTHLATQLALTFASPASLSAAEAKVGRVSANYASANSWDAVVLKHADIWKQTL